MILPCGQKLTLFGSQKQGEVTMVFVWVLPGNPSELLFNSTGSGGSGVKESACNAGD